jgi:hypothetical protein
LSWTFAGSNPASWQVWSCDVSGNFPALIDTLAGDVFSGVYGDLTYYYVVGVDGSGNPITPKSNIVNAGN